MNSGCIDKLRCTVYGGIFDTYRTYGPAGALYGPVPATAGRPRCAALARCSVQCAARCWALLGARLGAQLAAVAVLVHAYKEWLFICMCFQPPP